jgi:hypothetical protein
MVDGLPNDQRHRDDRYELHQPDQAEVERVAGHRVDLPTDRDRKHLIGGRRSGPSAPEIRE